MAGFYIYIYIYVNACNIDSCLVVKETGVFKGEFRHDVWLVTHKLS